MMLFRNLGSYDGRTPFTWGDKIVFEVDNRILWKLINYGFTLILLMEFKETCAKIDIFDKGEWAFAGSRALLFFGLDIFYDKFNRKEIFLNLIDGFCYVFSGALFCSFVYLKYFSKVTYL